MGIMMTGQCRSAPRRRTALVSLLLWAVLLVAGAGAGVARAQPAIDEVVAGLRRDPVYVDPSAESALEPATADRLRAEIAAAGTPIVVAILPASAGRPRELIDAIGSRLDRPVTVAVVAGRSFGAESTAIEGVGALADTALAEHRAEGAPGILLDFVRRVGEAASGQGQPSQPAGKPSGADGLLVPIMLVLGGGALGFAALRSKRRRDEQRRREFTDVRAATEEDLIALGEDIRALDLDVSMPGADRRAIEDYTAALDRYKQASEQFDRARQASDLAPVASALRLRGEEPPERRAPCFFDPRHGPSVTDVEWAPEGGVARMVPACAADAQRALQGQEPHSRHVLVDGTAVPYWSAPGWFAPWAGGYFGFGGPGLFTGLLLGQALAGGDFGGGDFGGGDFGGGDFGGGDFGGGDFGGGDFGGGDFGGGDF
jgi:hypothetical protein